MKNLITAILLTIFLTACSGGSDEAATYLTTDTTTTTTTTDTTPSETVLPPTVPEQTDTEQTPEILPHTIFVYNPTAPEVGTSDGTYFYQLAQEKAANARDGFISIGDILHGIDDTGTSIITQRLPTTPDKMAISGQDVWCFEIIDATYTKIYLNSDEYGTYTDNQWVISEAIVTDSGDIIALDTGGKYRNIQDVDMVVMYAGHGGLLIYGIDVATHRANIKEFSKDTRVAFSMNYFFRADEWIEADGIYYSWNGYTWDGTTLTEMETQLSDFVLLWYPEKPVLIAVGSRIEHGEAVTYWIECNTGWLYRHTPSINSLEKVIQLYQGDGTRDSGITAKGEIKPVLVGDNMYYGWGGTIWKYNFTDSLVSSFAAGVEIWGM